MNINVAGKQNSINCDIYYFATETDQFLSSLMAFSHIS
jgi:hypothetical protein